MFEERRSFRQTAGQGIGVRELMDSHRYRYYEAD